MGWLDMAERWSKPSLSVSSILTNAPKSLMLTTLKNNRKNQCITQMESSKSLQASSKKGKQPPLCLQHKNSLYVN